MLLFFDIGTGEFLLIVIVLFIVLGPKRMPEAARTLGKAINEMKRASAGFKNEINKEVQKLERETQMNEFIQERKQTNREKEKLENKPVVERPETSIHTDQVISSEATSNISLQPQGEQQDKTENASNKSER